MYRVGHLVFGLPVSTIGYFEFERRNNIYNVSEIWFFVWHLRNGSLYAWTKLGNFENLLSKWWVFNPNCKKFTENLIEKKCLQFVNQFVKRIWQFGSLLDKVTRSHARPVRSTENIVAVAQNVLEQPSTSTRHRSQNLNISLLWEEFWIKTSVKSYKVQLVQELKSYDHPMRFSVRPTTLGWTTLGWRWAFLPKNHLFWRSSFSPRWLCEQAGLSYLGIRESVHRHGEADASTTSDWLMWFLVRRHLRAIFLQKWTRSCQWRALPRHDKRIPASQIWRGGHRRHLISTGPCHTANATIDLLRTVFENRIISRNTDVN